MRPSKLKPGAKLKIKASLGSGYSTAYFIKREPAENGQKAVNYLRFPVFAGLNGPDDDGTSTMGDYHLSRQGSIVG